MLKNESPSCLGSTVGEVRTCPIDRVLTVDANGAECWAHIHINQPTSAQKCCKMPEFSANEMSFFFLLQSLFVTQNGGLTKGVHV